MNGSLHWLPCRWDCRYLVLIVNTIGHYIGRGGYWITCENAAGASNMNAAGVSNREEGAAGIGWPVRVEVPEERMKQTAKERIPNWPTLRAWWDPLAAIPGRSALSGTSSSDLLCLEELLKCLKQKGIYLLVKVLWMNLSEHKSKCTIRTELFILRRKGRQNPVKMLQVGMRHCQGMCIPEEMLECATRIKGESKRREWKEADKWNIAAQMAMQFISTPVAVSSGQRPA